MREAKLDAYRFSISWPRILPEGVGTVNQAGVDHYSRFVDDLLAAGIAPLPTLYHWDFPQALHAKGGWHNRDVIGWFADYAAVVFRALADRVSTFITLNEPYIDLFMMDLIAEKARDKRPIRCAIRAPTSAARRRPSTTCSPPTPAPSPPSASTCRAA